jgi:hypothetical protein
MEKKETVVKKMFNANGGNIQLKGNNFTLITFHGTSFKANKWAVFSLNEPSMDFASQSHHQEDEIEHSSSSSSSSSSTSLIDKQQLHNQQTLTFYLGRNERKSIKNRMASIYMVNRDSASIFTKFQTISEWFEYAHSTIDAAGLRDFPRFASDDNSLLLTQTNKKGNKYSEQTKFEEIFHLPSLQVFCDTSQLGNIVKFGFKTDFHDHIAMTFRTELFSFLHELITSYMKETEISLRKEQNVPEPAKDERVYECSRWVLEPTLRLFAINSMKGTVEPPGVDTVLKSLGFHHARSTIPKWLQRGLFDNLHDIMENLIKVYIKLLSDSNPNNNINANNMSP